MKLKDRNYRDTNNCSNCEYSVNADVWDDVEGRSDIYYFCLCDKSKKEREELDENVIGRLTKEGYLTADEYSEDIRELLQIEDIEEIQDSPRYVYEGICDFYKRREF